MIFMRLPWCYPEIESGEIMSEISVEIGKRIRHFRKSRSMTLEELATTIHKSKATLFKYEKGDISIDLDTLYDLADALSIHAEQLLLTRAVESNPFQREVAPAFFRGLCRFYSYYFDGRNEQLNRSTFDVFSQIDTNRYKIAMYMNYKDLEHYQQSENTYWGYIEHYDVLSLIEMTHQNTATEKASIQIHASFLDSETKWGLWNGISSRPLMPVALKMLFSKKPLREDVELNRQLKVSKEDIRHLKYYNMFTVI